MKRIDLACFGFGVVLILAVVLGMVCEAKAEGFVIKPHAPIYAMTHYASERDDTLNSPFGKVQASLAVALADPFRVGSWTLGPEAAFSWTGWNALREESSPFVEHVYTPELYVVATPDSALLGGFLQELRGGWLHESNGVGEEDSRGWDRITVDATLEWEYLTVILRGWYAYSYGENSEAIASIANFKLGDAVNIGGDLDVSVTLDAFDLVGSFGLDWQELQVFVPLQETYNLDLYVQLHNGKMDGMLDYEQPQASGGAGLAIRPQATRP